jgi:hypothetical protein
MPGGFTALWESHGGCETGPVVPKPGDPDIVYANCKGRFGVYNRRTDQEMQYYVGVWNLYGHNPEDLAYRFQRVAPIHVSPHDPNRVYHTSQFVHVTNDGGRTWETISPDLTAFTEETQVISGSPITIDVTGEEHFSTIYEIQESPHEPGVIWVGSNDGPIHLTRDGGENWQDVTPPELGPYGRVQTIEVSPHNPAKAYAAVLRYQLGDFEPYAFKTEDYGVSWTRITNGSNGIPADSPVRVVREDPDREGLLYAGTEFGMFISLDDGQGWYPFQMNLPVTPVTDIKIVEKDLALSTMGRGFWILYDLTPVHEYSDALASREVHLFKVRDAFRLYVRGGRSRSPDTPQYPENGVNIDYYLSKKPKSPLTLEFLDSQGRLIRKYASEPGDPEKTVTYITEPSPGEEGPGSSRPLLVPSAAGFHRFTWNLRHPGPWGQSSSRSSGPMVVPGRYQVKLTVGSESMTQEFQVHMDPRITREGIALSDIENQIQLALKTRDLIGEARKLAVQVHEAIEIADDPSPVLIEIKSRLITNPIRYSKPVIIDQIKYLYSSLLRADQAPGKDALDRYEELHQQVMDCKKQLQEELD